MESVDLFSAIPAFKSILTPVILNACFGYNFLYFALFSEAARNRGVNHE
jgi:hypothetical protein